MQMWSSSTTGPADSANPLALADGIAQLHIDARKMKEGAIETHSVVNHHKVAFKRERARRGQNDYTIGGRYHRRSCAACKIDACMGCAGRARIDALRPEMPRDATRDWPDEVLSPPLGTGDDPAGGRDLFKLGRPPCFEFRVWSGKVRQAREIFNNPTGCVDPQCLGNAGPVFEVCSHQSVIAMISPKARDKVTIRSKAHVMPVDHKPDCARRNNAPDQRALLRLAIDLK